MGNGGKKFLLLSVDIKKGFIREKVEGVIRLAGSPLLDAPASG